RQPISKIRTIGRVTQEVRLVKLDEGSTITSITRVVHEEEATEAIGNKKTEEDEQKTKGKNIDQEEQ
ncbi:uncharacterized protein METZ01_LOCUS116986, partial [marine metagenome]